MSQSWFEKKMEEKNRRPEFEQNFFMTTIENLPWAEIKSVRLVEGNGYKDFKENCFQLGVQAVVGLRETGLSDGTIRYYGTGIKFTRKSSETK